MFRKWFRPDAEGVRVVPRDGSLFPLAGELAVKTDEVRIEKAKIADVPALLNLIGEDISFSDIDSLTTDSAFIDSVKSNEGWFSVYFDDVVYEGKKAERHLTEANLRLVHCPVRH